VTHPMRFLKHVALALACAVVAAPLAAEEIVVSNYGVSANGMPYAIAMEKGYF